MVIWGWRTTVQTLMMLTLVCGQCHNPAAHNLFKRVTKFTLFFIPLFPLSRKFGLQCTFCGCSYDIDKAAAEQLQAQAQQAQQQPAQGQYPQQQAVQAQYPQQGYPQQPHA